MTAVLKDDTELFKQFMDNDGFRRSMIDTVFRLTSVGGGRRGELMGATAASPTTRYPISRRTRDRQPGGCRRAGWGTSPT